MLIRLTMMLMLALALTACGDEGGTGDDGDTTDTGDATTGDDTGEDTGPPPPVCEDASDEDFLAIFGYRWRVQGIDPPEGASKFDLQMIRPVQKYEPINLTGFLPEADGLNCDFGCLIDESLSFIGINAEPPDQNGDFDFKIGLFNDCLDVKLKGLTFQDKAHFAFAGHYVYYSERKSCNGPSCQYEIWRVNLDNPSETDLLVPFFPPSEDADWKNGDTTFKGRFHVSPDGESLVMLSPTIRSLRIYLWTKGTLHEVDYLCNNFQNDTCIGAGSSYSDNDAVAISPDSKHVVVFTTDNRALMARRYSTENPNDTGRLTMLAVQPDAGNYQDLACVVRQPWQYTQIISPSYTPDGSKLVFVGRSDCIPGADKIETDILYMDPARIDKLQPLEEKDIVNLTQNPKDQSPDNIVVTGIDVSPDGKRVLFTGTPNLTSAWKPINDTDARHLSDREMWMMSICGGAKEQLTSAVSFEASSPVVLKMPDVSDCPGHPLSK